MTQQIDNLVLFEGLVYELTEPSIKEIFHPRSVGIEPEFWTTACWDGYHCLLQLTNVGLRLQRLVVRSQKGNYPAIGKVRPRRLQDRAVYSKLNYPLNVKGTVIFGRDYFGPAGEFKAASSEQYGTVIECILRREKTSSIRRYANAASGPQ